MSRFSNLRCQLCGRRKHLRRDGGVVHHCVGGLRCPGSGHPPIEHDDARLMECVANAQAAFERANRAVTALEEANANWIDPALVTRRAVLSGESLRLDRRLKRHLEWPARYERSLARQMEEQGYAWAEPPPAYLVLRLAQAARELSCGDPDPSLLPEPISIKN